MIFTSIADCTSPTDKVNYQFVTKSCTMCTDKQSAFLP